MNVEDAILDNIDLDAKISATENPTMRVAARKFLEESCELAKILPPHKKMLFYMRYSHGFSIKEIANLCNVTTNAVTKRLKTITEELNGMRKCVSEDEEDGDVDKSTKERIAVYFRREDERRTSLRKG